MLPPRSKRFVGSNGRIERLKLTTPLELSVATLLVLLLFALIFPRRALVEALHRQEQLDDLTLAYIENLRRVTTGDDDLTLLVTRVEYDQLDYPTIEARLLPIIEKNDRLKPIAERLLNKARLREMHRLLAAFHGEAGLRSQLRHHYLHIRQGGDRQLYSEAAALWLETLYRSVPSQFQSEELKAEVLQFLTASAETVETESQRLTLVALAMMAGLEKEAKALLTTIDPKTLGERLSDEAAKALGYGFYETAAMLHLLEREYATDKSRARTAYMKAIETLMAGNLYTLAMESAERHLGDLADDRATLRFLIHTALAAGDTKRAAAYARRLVFMTEGMGKQ